MFNFSFYQITPRRDIIITTAALQVIYVASTDRARYDFQLKNCLSVICCNKGRFGFNVRLK